MISEDHVLLMARYNHWQNTSLYSVADQLGEAGRLADCGAFFRSIQGTLSHLLWGDGVWMHRFSGLSKPAGGIKDSAGLYPDWDQLKTERQRMDQAILDWAGAVTPAWLGGSLSWYSGAAGRDVSKPAWLLVTHLFNHQTHHRGQVHAMLTAAGGKPDDTDLFYLNLE